MPCSKVFPCTKLNFKIKINENEKSRASQKSCIFFFLNLPPKFMMSQLMTVFLSFSQLIHSLSFDNFVYILIKQMPAHFVGPSQLQITNFTKFVFYSYFFPVKWPHFFCRRCFHRNIIHSVFFSMPGKYVSDMSREPKYRQFGLNSR